MKNTTGAAIALAAAITAGGLAMAIPSQAASSSSSPGVSNERHERGDHTHATISATVTGIPSTVTDSHQVAMGAYFRAYVLAEGEAVPSTAPTTSRPIHVGMRGHHEDVAVSGSTLTADLRLPGGSAGTTTKVALYPSDGTGVIVVTIKVDANSVATVSSTKSLTVAYSAAVAADSEANMPKGNFGKGPSFGKPGAGEGRPGHGEGKRGGHKH